jgi:hypothetical protein
MCSIIAGNLLFEIFVKVFAITFLFRLRLFVVQIIVHHGLVLAVLVVGVILLVRSAASAKKWVSG